MITVDGLYKNYGKIKALDNTSLHVNEGTIHGLIGPNGAGKSTTIKILSTLIRPDSGEISIGDFPLNKGIAIRGLIGVVPETPRLHEYLTAHQEITFYARLSGLNGMRASGRVDSVIHEMDLAPVAHQPISSFSTGMKKRVSLALAMVADPPILLLDEPMSGLDPVIRRQFKDIILKLTGKTILVSDHDLFTVDELCNRVTILKDGKTLVEDDIESMRKRMGKLSVEIQPVRPKDAGKLAHELGQLESVLSIEEENGWVIAIVSDPDRDIPAIIRTASNIIDIKEARQSRISLEEIFIKMAKGSDVQ